MGKKKQRRQRKQAFQTMRSLSSDVSATSVGYNNGNDCTTTASSSSQASESDRRSPRFSTRDKARLKKYLQAYRRGVYQRIGVNVDNDFGSGANTNNNHATRGKKVAPSGPPNAQLHDFVNVRIGGIGFPSLTEEQLYDQPYIALPATLSPHQRRDVHLVAMQVGLFHNGFEGSWLPPQHGDNRFVAVSVFEDGLNFVENNANEQEEVDNELNQPFVPVEKYKPWIRKRSNGTMIEIDRAKDTKEGKNLVYRMFDQPGLCLRDGLDTIDLETMKGMDLSHRTPPGSGDDDQNDNSWMYVDTADKMKLCIKELEEAQPTELAFDLECYNKSKYVQVTCLLQLATNRGKDYVVDVLGDDGRVWDMVGPGLAKFFADPNIVKIGHSIAGLDVQCLHRDFGIFVVNAFDTFEAAHHLHQHHQHGLAKVCKFYGLPGSDHYETLKEMYQNSDWTRRPLPEPAIMYGRFDVYYLIDLRRLLMRDLVKSEIQPLSLSAFSDERNQDFVNTGGIQSMHNMLRSFNEEDGIEEDDDVDLALLGLSDHDDDGDDENGQPSTGTKEKTSFDAKDLRMNLALMAVISKSQERCLGLWSTSPEPPMKNVEFQSIMVQAFKENNPWTTSQITLYERMASWREAVADKEECLAGFVCTLDFLSWVAMKRPASHTGLRQIRWHLPHLLTKHVGKYMKQILAMVEVSRWEDKLGPHSGFLTYREYQEKRLNGVTRKNDSAKAETDHASWIFAATFLTVVAAVTVRLMVTKFNERKFW